MGSLLRPLLMCLSLVAWVAHADAPPAMTGLFQVAGLGLVDFTIKGGRTQGTFKAGGDCQLKPEVQVMDGAFESNVFVGSVLVCQEGAGCAVEKRYPFLGVWRDDALVGSIKLDTGCSSPGLDGARLHVSPASGEDKRKLLEGSLGSAVDVARTNTNPRDVQKEIEQALAQGEKKLDDGDFRGARDQFARVVSYEPDRWMAHMGLGIARTKLKDPTGAIESLSRAQDLASRQRAGDGALALVYFNIACAQSQLGRKNDALKSLKLAMRLGGPALHDPLMRDPDLAPLHATPEFKQMAAIGAGDRKKPR